MTSLPNNLFPVGHRYRVLEKIGEGGMGVVFKVQDRLTGDALALKQVSTPATALQFTSKSDKTDKSLALASEFKLLAGLRHPHIVSVLDYGFADQHAPYYTMELLTEARSVTDYGSTQDEAGKVRILIEILQALTYLHRRNIIHRDLKSANVQITQSGVVKVMDFGLALNYEQSFSRTEALGIIGTIPYMAPELFDESPPTVQSDLYAVGVMAYELLVGERPYAGKNIAVLMNRILTTDPDYSALPPQWQPILTRLLEKKPSNRYRTAAAVIEALCEATDQSIPSETVFLRESFLQASSFVGRETEIDTLKTALTSALEGQGSAWLVGGESGVGKSRLAEELRTLALVRGATVLKGQAVAEGGRPYHLWRDPIRHLALSVELNDLEAGVLKTVAADIADLIGREVADVPLLEGPAGATRLGLTIVDVFKRYCENSKSDNDSDRRRPIVLLLEDLHWVDESLKLLELLNRAVSSLPVFIVGTYRDEERPKLGDELPDMTQLKLTRFSEATIARMTRSMLGIGADSPEIVELIKNETEGNAFFMVEVIRSLAEEAGSLSDIGRMSLPRHVLAGGIQQVVRRRLARAPQKNWLKLAAVLGRELDLKVLRSLLQLELEQQTMGSDPLASWLTACAEAAVLEVVDDKWRFSHDKLRETLLADLTEEERQTLNRQAAEGIEATYPGDENRAAVLTDYWFAAGDVPKAAQHAVVYCEQLWTRRDVLVLVSTTDRVLALLEGNEAVSDTIRMKLLHLSGHANNLSSHLDAAKVSFQKHLELAQKWNNRSAEADALLGLGQVTLNSGAHEEGARHIEKALALYEADENRRGVCTATRISGVAHYYQGNFEEAQIAFQKGLEIAQELNQQADAAGNLINLGSVALVQGQREKAQRYWEQSLQGMREIGNLLGIGQSLQGLGNAARDQGDFAAARRYYEEGVDILRKIGNRRGEIHMMQNLGYMLVWMGQMDNGQKMLETSLVLSNETGDRRTSAISFMHLGEIHTIRGDFAAARQFFEDSLAIFRDMDERAQIADVLFGLGLNELAAGSSYQQIAKLFHESLERSYSAGVVEAQLKGVIGAAWLHLRRGKATAAAELTGLVAAHPARTAQVSDFLLTPLRKALLKELGEPTYNSAAELGQTLELNTVVELLLNELATEYE